MSLNRKSDTSRGLSGSCAMEAWSSAAIVKAILAGVTLFPLLDLDEGGNGWHTVAVHKEQHVITRRGEISVRWSCDTQTTRSLTEAQRHRSFVLVKEVRHSTSPNQGDGRNTRTVRCADKEIRSIMNLIRRLLNAGTGSFEEIWW